MTIDLYYHPGSGPCRTVMLTAKLLGVDLNLIYLDLMNKEQLNPEFVKINPQHTVPTLVDNGFVLWESYAIATYLIEKYGKDDSLYSKDQKQRALINQRMYFSMGTLNNHFGQCYYPVILENAAPDPAKLAKVEEAVKLLDTFLEGHEFVAGNNLTVADIPLVTTVVTFELVKFDLSPYKNVTRWYNKMKSVLPGYEEINGIKMLSKLFAEFQKNKK